MAEIEEKSFAIFQARAELISGESSCDKSDVNDLGPSTLGLVGLTTTANYEEVVSEIANGGHIAAVTQNNTANPNSSHTVMKYDTSDIVMTESEGPHKIEALGDSPSSSGLKPTIDSAEIAKLVEVATEVEKDVTDPSCIVLPKIPPNLDIGMREPESSNKVETLEDTPQNSSLKPTIDSAEIAKLVEVATKVEKEVTNPTCTGTPLPKLPDSLDDNASASDVDKKFNSRYVSTFEEARKVIEAHEILTGTKYVIWRGLAGFGNASPQIKGRRILWQEMRKSTDQMRHGIERDNIPFIVCGEIIYDCVHGNDNHKSWKSLYAKRLKEKEEKGTPIKSRKRIASSKKVGCPARIYLKEVIKFPDHSSPKFTEFHKKGTAKRLRSDVESGKNVNFEKRIYVCLPSIEEHKYHPIGGNLAEVNQVTFKAPINIAVVKYWGKRNTALNLPLNSSLSVTLGLEEISAKTTVAMSTNFNEDKFWLNGKKQDIRKSDRIQNCLKELRKMARKRKGSKDKCCLSKQHLHICSENNFPTAAGLASSAAGYACLTAALSKLLGVENEVSHIARQGSGSACRSMYGGFVKWNRGEMEDGMDSIAVQIAPEGHWPELKVLVAVVNDQQKKISSTEGMQRSAATSELLWYRAAYVVPIRMEEMEKAILEKDFEKFAELTMKESSQLHAVCLDTYPSIEPPYLNEVSHQIMELVTVLNEVAGRSKAAFTFDAGPNAFIFTTDEYFNEVLSLLESHFKPDGVDGESFFRGINSGNLRRTSVDPVVIEELNNRKFKVTKGGVKYIICTKCGCGPEELPFSESLLNPFGLPIDNQNLCENILEQPTAAKL